MSALKIKGECVVDIKYWATFIKIQQTTLFCMNESSQRNNGVIS